jgi:hypothetical protein
MLSISWPSTKGSRAKIKVFDTISVATVDADPFFHLVLTS